MDKRVLNLHVSQIASAHAVPKLMLPEYPQLVHPAKPIFESRQQRREHDRQAVKKGLLPIVAREGFLTITTPKGGVVYLKWANGDRLKAGDLPPKTKVHIDVETGRVTKLEDG